jgi:hypothetical protein
MRRKHYEALAGALKRSKPKEEDYDNPYGYEMAMLVWRRTVRYIVAELKKDNDKFNIIKFEDACGC